MVFRTMCFRWMTLKCVLAIFECFVAIALGFSAPVCVGQTLGAVSGLTLDAALNKAADRVDSSVEKAGAVANGTVIRAGSEVNAEIDNFREAYKDLLSKTVNQLGAEATKQLSQIFSDADSLEMQTASDAKRVVALSQQVINTVPLAKIHPQITGISPAYDVYSPTRTDAIALTVEGNFVNSGDKGMTPYIEVAGKRVAPIHITTQHLLFMVPRSVLQPKDGKATAYVKLPIGVPYKDGVIFKTYNEAKFSALLIGLPESPGTITLQITTQTPSVKAEHHSTPQFNLQSDRDDHTEVICGPNETDRIEPSSVKTIFEHVEGSSWTTHPVRVDNPSVCYWFRTEHHGIGTSDKLWFHYEYDVAKTASDATVVMQPVKLKWGESQTFGAPAGNFIVKFDAFDGSHQEYISQNHKDRYIDISTEGNGLRIAARSTYGILPLN